jgi:flagellar protein FlgJ
MNPATANSFHFADFEGFAGLRREAAADTPEARRAVAQQFEALFLNQLLQQMREAGRLADGLFDSEQTRPYQSMHDQQLALSLAQGPGIGLADAILRQFGETAGAALAPPIPSNTGSDRLARIARRFPESAASAVERLRGAGGAPFRPETPADFVAAVRPHAARAARQLGIAPEVLIAQAALESGWGRAQIAHADGAPSFNLFGIKATSGWRGDRVTVSTLEFIDGVPERRREQFRAYANLGEAFADYVKVIAGQSRYASALAAGTGEGYLRGLQAGGYATDPHYADKILGILRRGLPGQTIQVSAGTADKVAQPERPEAAVGSRPTPGSRGISL